MSAGLLIVRLVLGLGFAAHGAQKLFGWFGGPGIDGTAGFFGAMGFRPGKPFAVAASLAEICGGILTALGLFGPLGQALMILVMIVAMVTVHMPHGFFAAANGIEVPLLYAIGALAIAVVGPGDYSLDAALGLHDLSSPRTVWIALAAAVVLAIANLALRRPPAATPASATS
jgi:putative oxidoreductase